MRSFLPNAAELTSPLRELLKKDTLFLWSETHSMALNKIKDIICKAPVLAAFDEKLVPVIQTDSSKNGIGCVLLQNNKPIEYYSRCLTDTEKEYAQIEKEMLAVVVSVLKFHYIYGRKMIVVTDHKPLLSIMKKLVSKICNVRLQRLKLKLIKYDIELVYRPGKELYIADYLSRHFLKDPVEEDQSMTEIVHSVSVHARISDNRRMQFKQEIGKDETMTTLIKYINNEWPQSRKQLRDELKWF